MAESRRKRMRRDGGGNRGKRDKQRREVGGISGRLAATVPLLPLRRERARGHHTHAHRLEGGSWPRLHPLRHRGQCGHALRHALQRRTAGGRLG